MTCSRFHLAALVSLILSSSAHAGPESAPPSPARGPWLSPGTVVAAMSMEASLTLREIWEPVSLAPDVFFGMPNDVTVGIFHSTRAAGLLDSGAGICLGGESGGCDDPYSGLGVLASWRGVARGGWQLGPSARLFVSRFERPSRPRLSPGLLVAWERGRWSALVDAHLILGLGNRDRGNASRLNVPMWFGAQLAGPVDLFLRTGIDGALEGFGDQYAIPLGLGAGVRLFGRVRAELQFALPKIGGPLNSERPKDLLLRVAWSL